MTEKKEQRNLLYNCRKDENHNTYMKLTARILHLRIRSEIVRIRPGKSDIFQGINSLKLIHTGSGSKLLHTQHSIKIEHNIMDTQ